MHLPDPPVNVRIVLTDGSEVAVQTAYVGLVNGTHCWEIVEDIAVGSVAEMRFDELPASTSITLRGGW